MRRGSRGRLGGRVTISDAGQDGGEFVAAEPGERGAAAQGRGNDAREGFEHRIALGVAEKVVHFLEMIEVDEHYGEAALGMNRRGDLGVEHVVTTASVRQARQNVVMCEEADAVLGLLSGANVPDGDGDMGAALEVDRAAEQLDADRRAAPANEIGFKGRSSRRLGGLANLILGKEGRKIGSEDGCAIPADKDEETVVGGDDDAVAANQEPFDGGVREPAHALGFREAAPALALVQKAEQRKRHDQYARRDADDRHRRRRNRVWRNGDRWIGDDGHGGHAGEMETTDRGDQEDRRRRPRRHRCRAQGAAQAKRREGRADDHGGAHERAIPGHAASNPESHHPDIMRRRQADPEKQARDGRGESETRRKSHAERK